MCRESVDCLKLCDCFGNKGLLDLAELETWDEVPMEIGLEFDIITWDDHPSN